MVTLPSSPSGLIVSPAPQSQDYAPSFGDSIITTKYDWSHWNDSHVVTFTTVEDTISFPEVLIPPTHTSLSWKKGFQIVNASGVLQHGDSGGGVYFNGMFVGVNQALNPFNYPQLRIQLWNQ
jgi:hypothetical protein